jgi:hypothetical protein
MPGFIQQFWGSTEQLAIAFRVLSGLTLACPIALYFVNNRIDALKDTKISEQSIRIEGQEKHIGNLTGEISTLHADADELKRRAANAERNVSDTFGVDGVRRQTVGNKTSTTAGPETTIFKEMLKLQTEKSWAALVRLSEAQIVATPTWLTPYVMAAVGYANLGEKYKAIERLRFAVDKAGNDPNYAEAVQLLAQLQGTAPATNR